MYQIGKMPASIDIGYIGENLFRSIEIDMTAWVEKYPDGVCSIVHTRPGETDEDAYIADTTFDSETNVLTWQITEADLGTIAGEGNIQIWIEEERSLDDDIRGKSVNIKSIVNKSVGTPSSTPPAPQTAWLESMTALKTATVNAAEAADDAKDDAVAAKEAAEDAQEAAEAAAVHQPTVGQNGNWYVWNQTAGEYQDTQIPASGDPTILINDSSTANNRAWSAYKVDDELNTVKSALQVVENKFGTHYKDITPERMYGKFWNSQGDVAVLSSYGYYQAYYPVPVSPGDRCIISGYYGSSKKQHLALVVASDYTILQRIGTLNDREETHEVTIPENGAYVLMTTDQTTTYVSCYILVDNDIKQSVDGLFDFNGKNVAIIGDSISTNGDYSALNPLGNVPEIVIQSEDVGVSLSAYVTYYDIGTTVGGHEIVAADVGTELTFTPVAGDVGKIVGKPYTYNAATRKTWWECAKDALGFNPIPVCWSGASITSHEGSQDAYKTSYAWHPAQIRKCGIRIPGEMTRLSPDMIIIYRGTNDFSHSAYAKLTDGYFDNDSWTAPDTDVITGGFGFKEGLCLTIKKLREAYPLAKIVLCTMNFFKRVNYSTFPVNNGQNTENQFNDAIREVANYMGCGLIEFDKDGLTFENASSKYYVDQQTFTHPTDKGHKILGNKAIRDLMKENAFLW